MNARRDHTNLTLSTVSGFVHHIHPSSLCGCTWMCVCQIGCTASIKITFFSDKMTKKFQAQGLDFRKHGISRHHFSHMGLDISSKRPLCMWRQRLVAMQQSQSKVNVRFCNTMTSKSTAVITIQPHP